MGPCVRRDDGRGDFRPLHPDRRLLVFCVRLPCAACSRMLFFSSSRWPLVVSRGTSGALPGPLWLWLSSGIGGTVFVIMVSVINGKRQRRSRRDRSPVRIVANRKNRFSARRGGKNGRPS